MESSKSVERERDRSNSCGYVESPAKLEKEFAATLERKRQELDEQREWIKRVAAIRRAGAAKPSH